MSRPRNPNAILYQLGTAREELYKKLLATDPVTNPEECLRIAKKMTAIEAWADCIRWLYFSAEPISTMLED